MDYRVLGRTGLKISRVSLGSWATFGTRSNEDVALECVRYAYENGVNYFDTADSYQEGQGEIILGTALKKLGLRRSSYCVSTKFFFGRHDGPLERETLNRKYILSSLDQSLQSLGLDYVDMALCHRHDPDTDIEDVVETMDQVVRSGRALYWGTSEWSATQLLRAYDYAKEQGLNGPALEQPEYNLLRRYKVEHMFKPLIDSRGLGLVTWSPLSSGVLSGKYLGGTGLVGRAAGEEFDWLRERIADPETRKKVLNVKAVADRIGMPMSRLSIAWCLHNADVTSVLLGATSKEQLADNMAALDDTKTLDASIIAELDAGVGLECI